MKKRVGGRDRHKADACGPGVFDVPLVVPRIGRQLEPVADLLARRAIGRLTFDPRQKIGAQMRALAGSQSRRRSPPRFALSPDAFGRMANWET